MRRAIPIVCGSLIFLSSCQTSSPTAESANSYLQALQEGDAQTLANITCLTEPQKREPVAPGITSWKIIEETSTVSERDPAGVYTEVVAEIAYTGIASPVKDLFVLTVWKTEELHEYQLRSTERTNQLIQDTEKTVRASQELLGSSSSTDTLDTEPLQPPSRDGLTSREYCVTQLRRP